ncbi:DUF45 domain-containing protein [Xylophilus sp. Kf1]|nr:DUF45 domain-containing protein [Xylophilus sp. Kf1]
MAGLLQLALDFLGMGAPGGPGGSANVDVNAHDDGAAVPPPVRRAPRPARPGAKPPRERRTRVGAGGATTVVMPELDGMASLPRHPQANREALLMGRQVVYRLDRGRRRTVGFTVGADGLSVRAPGWLPVPQVEAALQEKADWILRKLVDVEQRRDRLESARIVWGDGASFLLRGQRTVVRLGARRGDEGLRVDVATDSDSDAGAAPAAPALWLALPDDAAPERIGEAVRAWMRREAQADFTARLERYAPLLGVQWARLSLTDARTRWGSASTSGAIRLHWRLMHFRPEVIDYVVAHELAHLRHMDHSPRFWSVVASVLPDYQALRAELRADASPRW